MSKAGTKKAKAKQTDLPGMEDRAFPDLNQAALDYAEGRDERMTLTQKEADLKTRVIELMHKYDKKIYVYEDITIELVPEGEKLKVKIHRDEVD